MLFEVGYGVTANIAASHCEEYVRNAAARGSIPRIRVTFSPVSLPHSVHMYFNACTRDREPDSTRSILCYLSCFHSAHTTAVRWLRVAPYSAVVADWQTKATGADRCSKSQTSINHKGTCQFHSANEMSISHSRSRQGFTGPICWSVEGFRKVSIFTYRSPPTN